MQAQQAQKHQEQQSPRGSCGTCANGLGGQCELHAQLGRGKLDVAHASRMREVHRKCPLAVWQYQPLVIGGDQ